MPNLFRVFLILFLSSCFSSINAQVDRELNIKNESQAVIDNSDQLLENYYKLKSQPALFRRGSHTTYKGEKLTGIQFPVGGIGTGCIQYNGHAQPIYWQIFNNMTHDFIPNSFFAVRIKSEKDTIVRALQTKNIGAFEGMSSLEAVAKYPFLEYCFTDAEVLANIRMEVFNPFVPTNLKASGIPVVFYNFYLDNPTNKPLEISLLASQQNAIGYSKVPINSSDKGFAYNFKAAIDKKYAKDDSSIFYGSNRNSIENLESSKVLVMNNSAPKDNEHFGQMALMLFDAVDLKKVQGAASWNNPQKLFDSFYKKGQIEENNKTKTPSKKGHTYSGAINTTITLMPGDKKKISMALAWYFPNGKNGGFKDKWDAWGNGNWEGNGNKYATYWTDIKDLIAYLNEKYSQLNKDSRTFSNSLFDTNLPLWLVERLANQLSILKSRTIFHDKNDYVGLWEGAGGSDGSCAGNCNHVWHYAQAHARLFPELGKIIRTQTFEHIKSDGQLPYRQPAGSFAFDGQCGDILGAYREYLLSEDKSWLVKYYPAIKKAMNYIISEHDSDKDGWLSDKKKHTTYDASMTGNPSFLSSLYLASLRASEKMAMVVNDSWQANEWKEISIKSAQKQNDRLWNGEYFYQIRGQNPATDYENGCHSDQLLGQWWADQLGLGELYPAYKIKAATDAILKYNFKSILNQHDQGHRTFALPNEAGMVATTWPKSQRPKYASGYSGEVWSTFEYTIGAQLIKYHEIRDALTVLRSGFNRYDGKLRTGYKGKWGNFGFSGNPFGDDECGQFYGRALSNWSVLLAAQGFYYNGPEHKIGFNPKWQPERHTSFFTTSKGWGVFRQHRENDTQENTISLTYGHVVLSSLLLKSDHKEKQHIDLLLNGKKQHINFTKSNYDVEISFNPISLKAGDKITIIMNSQR